MGYILNFSKFPKSNFKYFLTLNSEWASQFRLPVRKLPSKRKNLYASIVSKRREATNAGSSALGSTNLKLWWLPINRLLHAVPPLVLLSLNEFKKKC